MILVEQLQEMAIPGVVPLEPGELLIEPDRDQCFVWNQLKAAGRLLRPIRKRKIQSNAVGLQAPIMMGRVLAGFVKASRKLGEDAGNVLVILDVLLNLQAVGQTRHDGVVKGSGDTEAVA